MVAHRLVGVAGKGLVETTGVLALLQERVRRAGIDVAEAVGRRLDGVAALGQPAAECLTVAGDGGVQLLLHAVDDLAAHALVGERGQHRDGNRQQDGDKKQESLF
ncbi:hypothetical protein D3C72_1756360 [compost metagenome]